MKTGDTIRLERLAKERNQGWAVIYRTPKERKHRVASSRASARSIAKLLRITRGWARIARVTRRTAKYTFAQVSK